MKWLLFIILSVVFTAQGCRPKTQANSPAGYWTGAISVPGRDVSFDLTLVQQNGGAWTAALKIQGDDGPTDIAAADIVVQGTTVEFTAASVPESPRFSGTLSPDAESISGEVGPGRFPFKLVRSLDGEAILRSAPPDKQPQEQDDGRIIGLSDISGSLERRAAIVARHHPSIGYNSQPLNDPIVKLNDDLRSHRIELTTDGAQGYLRSVLQALNIPVESQVLVFSKTSFQSSRISPQNPRAIFFNDSVSVGWVRGGPILEAAAQDPRQGIVFYTLDQQSGGEPQFRRSDRCLSCHESRSAMDVPGMLVRSVFPGPNGEGLFQLGSFISDHRSPMAERWGGWYVTGKTAVLNLGNAVVKDLAKPKAAVPAPLSMQSLEGRFDTKSYPTPYSDVVALMVFNHQMHMMNLLTRIGWEVRFAIHQQATTNSRELTSHLIENSARELVDYMLFVDEPPLMSPVQGGSGFAENFAAKGPADGKGRSLRQFDLERRLMRFPCSYMIYAEAFDKLPDEARDAIYRRLWAVLSGLEKDKRYARLSLLDRRAIVEILRDTKKAIPDFFRSVTN